jgi:hypothetical protein
MVLPIERVCDSCGGTYHTGDAITGDEECPYCGIPLFPFSSLLQAQGADHEELPYPFVDFRSPDEIGYTADRIRELNELSRPSTSSA